MTARHFRTARVLSHAALESLYAGYGRRGGSGLGLPIAQKIVSEHGGAILASNRAAGGARIEIRLPVA